MVTIEMVIMINMVLVTTIKPLSDIHDLKSQVEI